MKYRADSVKSMRKKRKITIMLKRFLIETVRRRIQKRILRKRKVRKWIYMVMEL